MAAFSAANASAATYETYNTKSLGGGTGTLWNTSCTAEEAGGPNETYPIALNTAKPVNVTGTSNFVLSATVGGVAFQITCEGLESVGGTITNTEPKAGEMVGTGTGKSKFTKCKATKPAGNVCTVAETLETVELSSKTVEMGIKYTPKEGETFITITVGGASCPAALKGEKAVKGSAESATFDMVTQEFTAASGSALTFGGQAATFTGKYHVANVDGTGMLIGIGTP